MFRQGKQQYNHIVILNDYVHLVTVLIIFMSNLTHTRYKLMHSRLEKVPEIHPTS